MQDEPIFNPLDKKNLGVSVADALLDRPVSPLPPEDFVGAGIYAIYYVGGFSPYKSVVKKNIGNKYEAPIYVGKAVPAGTRKGGFGLDTPAGNVLYKRLAEHADSIEKCKNLKLEDFSCRYLVVDDIWIPLGESLLIEKFSPLWNIKIDGFGNHDPGSGRYNQKRSPWDEVHPGRPWAEKLQPSQKTKGELLKLVDEFINS